MGRPAKVDRPVRVEFYLPKSLDAELRVVLYSPTEGRIPHGALSSFLEQLVRNALAQIQLPKDQGNALHS